MYAMTVPEHENIRNSAQFHRGDTPGPYSFATSEKAGAGGISLWLGDDTLTYHVRALIANHDKQFGRKAKHEIHSVNILT
jgi:hypothetical protein